MKKLITLFVLALSLTGCAAVMKALPTIAAVISDAQQTLEIVDVGVQEWIRRTDPPEEQRARYAKIRQNAYRALSLATRGVRGIQDMDQEQYDTAFKEFRESYGEMKDFLDETGAMRSGALSSSGEAEALPEPLAMSHTVD